jgi:protein kinase-like protein
VQAATADVVDVALAIDHTTLKHLAIHVRGLVRLRVENRGPRSIPAISLAATLSGEPLAVATGAELAPGAHATFAIATVPAIAGYHALAGELRAGAAAFRFADVHVLVGGDGPQVNVITIDQSSARVVDNSRSTFGADDASGGLLGEGDWRPIELARVAAPTPAEVAAPALPRVDFTVRTDAATYRVTETLARGDIATIYGGRAAATGAGVALKVADQASDNDLLQHEVRVLGLVLATPSHTAIHFAPPRDQFRTADGRLGSVFDRLDGFDLTQIRDVFRGRGEPGLPARHVVWILRRALAALGWAHQQGILHGNLDPSHVLVRGRDHMVWLVDWCWAVVNPAQTGQGFKALNETYSPPEVAARGKPTPASDLYALGKCAIHVLGGDPAAKTVPDGVDARLARFLRYLCVESQGGRGQDAWELYMQLDKLREQIWGKHEFVPLDLSHPNGERT